MAFIMCNVPDDLNARIEGVRSAFNELGVEASRDDMMSYLLEEALDILTPDIETNLRRHRFLSSFDKDNGR